MQRERIRKLRRSCARRALRPCLQLESLEARLLLSGDPINAPLSSVQRQALIAGLTDVANWTGSMASTQQLNLPLALVGQSIRQLANPSQMISTGIIAELNNTTQSALNTDQFVAAIQNLSRTAGDLTITVNPANVTGGLVSSGLQNELQFQFAFEVVRQSSTNLAIDFGPSVAAMGWGLDGPLSLPLASRLQFGLTFGLDITPGLTSDQAFFIRPGSLSLGSSVNANNLNVPSKVGLLSASLIGGNLDLNATVGIAFTNPDLDALGNITLSELKGNPVDVIGFQTTTQAALSGSLPVQATLGAQLFDAATLGSTPSLQVTSGNVFAGPELILATPNSSFRELQYFTNLPASGLLTALERTGRALQDLTPALDVNPTLGGFGYTDATTSNTVDLGATFGNLSRSLYDPVVSAARAMSLGSGYSLDNDAVFTVRINGTESVNVTVPRLSQSYLEPIATFINRFLPTAIRTRITAASVVGAGGSYFTFRAVDPAITQVEILFSDLNNSIAKNLGVAPGQLSLPSYRFDSIQAFASRLASQTNLASVEPFYDIPNHRLSFRVQILGSAQATLVPLRFDDGLGPLNYSKPTTATFSVTPSLDGRLGIELDGLQTVLTATGDAPSNGQLSGTATFRVSLDGAAPVTVTVPKDIGNASIDDLVTDINAALALTLLRYTLTAGRVGNRLTLTSATGTGLLVEATAGNPAATQLQLAGVGVVAQWNDAVSLTSGSQLRLESLIASASITGAASLGILPVNLSAGSITITADTRGSLGRLLTLSELANPTPGDFLVVPALTTLAGNFVPAVDAALQVTAANPASLTLGLAVPNQWATRLQATGDAPANGRLLSAAKLVITWGEGTSVDVDVPVDSTNQSMDDLVVDINAAIGVTRLRGNVVASRSANRIVLSSSGFYALRVDSPAGNSGDISLHLRGITASPAIVANANAVFQERLAPLSTFRIEDFIGGVQGIVDLFDNHYLNHLTSELPLIGQSLDDVLGASQKLKASIVTMQAQGGLSLKLAAQGIVNNLRNAIRSLPSTLPVGSMDDLNAVYEILRRAAQNAERVDIPSQVHLASVIVASITPYMAAIAKVNLPGTDMVPLNQVLAQLQGATPSLLQLASGFSTAMGVGVTTGTFANAKLDGFQQALIVRTTWNDSLSRALPLTSLALPNGLGPLKFAAGSTVTMSATRDFKFDFGFNFSTGLPFLLDTSRFNASASLATSGSTYAGKIGGIAVNLGNPSKPISILLRTAANGTPARFDVRVNTTSDTNDIGNIPFASVPASLNYSSVDAKMDAVMPVFVTGVDRGNVTMAWTVPGASLPTPPVVTAPNDLVPTLQSLPYDFSILTDGIDQWNVRFKELIRAEILAKFPLVGDDLNIDQGFIQYLENQFASAVDSAIAANGGIDSTTFRTALYDNIESALGTQLAAGSLSVTATGSPEIRFRMRGSDAYTAGLDSNLPGLNFQVTEGSLVRVRFDYDMLLGFGLSKTEGFYFVIQREPANPTGPQLRLDIAAELDKDSQFKAGLLELPVVVTPKLDAGGQSVSKTPLASILVTLPDTDNHLTIDQVDSSLFANEFQIRFGSGGATSRLSLFLAANASDPVLGDLGLPNLVTDLLVDQNFPAGSGLDMGTIPQVRLNNIGLGLGSTLTKIVKPIVDKVNDLIAPVRPAILALDQEVPMLSKLVSKAGGGRVTWLDAIQAYSDDPDIDNVVAAMRKVVDLVKGLNALSSRVNTLSTSAQIVFGDYIFSPVFDLRQLYPAGIDPFTAGTFVPRPEFTPTNNGTISPYVRDSDPAIGGFLGDELYDDGFRFPIFEDAINIIPLLFGRDITFVTWDLPPFKTRFKSPEIYIGTILVGPVPVSLNVGMLFQMGANIGIGFDSRGFREGHDFIDGFFFKDQGRAGPPVLSVGAGVYANASAGIPYVASVGIEGELTANLNGRWNNIDQDDRYHYDEVLDNLANGPQCLMNLSGSIEAQLSFYISYVTYSVTIPITPRITLFDWDVYACTPLPPPELAQVTTTQSTVDGNVLESGTLILHVGPFAPFRNPGKSMDGDDRMSVTQVAPGIVSVTGYGQSKTYGTAAQPVTAIYADGGIGNNAISMDATVTLPTLLLGGPGDDVLRGGSGPNHIIGRGGKDILIGGIVDDIIEGGGLTNVNEAKMYGGPGNDRLVAFAGINFLDGEDGEDILQGGPGPDDIYGGRGDDQIFGGGGADKMFGEEGNDTIFGQGFQGVYVEGGRGDNLIFGSNGPDTIYASIPSDPLGFSGRNTVFANAGNDVVYGGIDNFNEIHGGPDDDLLYGGNAADLIHADSGIDLVYGFGGDDTLYADSGVNTIYGGVGNDVIYGSSGNGSRPFNWPSQTPYGYDDTYAGSGVDSLYGEAGNDTIYGGVGTGSIDGGSHGDFLFGGTGEQYLFGGDGDDLIRTGDGNQHHSGDAGNDLLEQRVAASQTLTDTTLLGRGDQSYALIERIQLINSSLSGGMVFDVGGYRGTATLIGSVAFNDTIRTSIDADIALADGNLKTSMGGSFLLQNIVRAQLTGVRMDNLFDVSLWTGTATLTGGTGLDRVVSVGDFNVVLSDALLSRTNRGAITLSGIRAITLAGGLSNNTLDATDFSGSAWMYGGGGNDVLRGGSGDDYLDGGLGTNTYYGNGGDDVIVAIAGGSATIFGGDGDDVIYGSEFNDPIDAGAGRDRVYARGGIDTVNGGDGDDILDGGLGNDILSGDAGSDVIVGGPGNDILYAFRASGSGDDGLVNYLYGDFGTAGDEPGVGNDTLNAGIGSDWSFGEGGTNNFTGGGPGAERRDGVAPGLRSSVPPADPPIPVPDFWPPTLSGQSSSFTIDGVTSTGRWTELNGSGSEGGVSRSVAAAQSPVVAVGAAGPWLAWTDARSGSPQVYVDLNTIAGWQEYAGSASGGGISDPTGGAGSRAERPSIVLDSAGLPIVAWTQVVGSSRNIVVARFDALANSGNGAWVALGTSLNAGGISGTGLADRATVVMTTDGPVVAWLETVGGVSNVYAKRFQGGAWVGLGTNGSSGSGVSGSATSISEFAMAADGNNVSILWTQSIGARTQIYGKALLGTTWTEQGGSSSGNGISGTTGSASAPSLVSLSNGQWIAAWQDASSGRWEIYAARYEAGQWLEAGDGARSSGGVSNTRGSATAPKLAANGDQVSLVWQDDRRAAGTGNSTALYFKRWKVNQFVEELSGDSRDRGIALFVGAPGTHAVALDAAGHPFVAWSDTASGKSEVYLQVNKFDLGTVHYVNDLDLTANAVAENAYSLAAGNDARNGLTPQTPKRTIQSVLNDASNPLGVGDVILVDAGSHVGAQIAGAAKNGVLILGPTSTAAILTTPLNITAVDRLTVSGLRTLAGIRITNATQVTIQDNDLRNAGVTFSGGSDVRIVSNQFLGASTAVMISGNAQGAIVASNVIRNGSTGLRLTTGAMLSAASSLNVRNNRIDGTTNGLIIETTAQGRISRNRIANASTGMQLLASFAGLITENTVRNSSTGILYAAANSLDANLLVANTTGIATSVGSTANGLGYFGTTRPNRIQGNTTGISLSQSAVVQRQYVWGNSNGVTGVGSVIPNGFSDANTIGRNDVGINISGTIQYTHFQRNTIAIAAADRQLIAHNELLDNALGVDIVGDTDVRIFGNTMVTKSGSNIRLRNSASVVEIRNNILWTGDGYNMDVDNNSTAGFFSDYNTLIAGAGGKLVYWTKDFTDLLDWQEDVAKFDLHSTGSTALAPRGAEPRFVSRGLQDLRLFDLTARLRFTSPSVDAGDPLADQARDPEFVNQLTNPSFESGLTGWTVTPGTSNIGSIIPAAFDGLSYFKAGTSQTTTLEQSVDLIAAGFLPGSIDALQYAASFGARVRSANETPIDRGTLIVSFLDASGSTIGTSVSMPAANVSDRWELLGDRAYLPALTRRIRFRYEAVLATGASNDVFIDHAFVSLTLRGAGIDVGALGNATTDLDTAPHLRLLSPDLYKDWERDKPVEIRWDSFGNAAGSAIAIQLLQDSPSGPVLVTNISTGTVDDGSFSWIAANSGIDYGTYGLRIRISLAANATIMDRSIETFTVPENTITYFVNDRSSAGDESTLSLGSNRNTGKLASAPKPYPNNVLRIYTLSSGDTLTIDTGNYPLLSPLIVSNILGVGDDEGFLMRGSVSHSTQWSHANPWTIAPILELNDADFMTLRNLTLVGGTIGLSVRNGSTNLNADGVRALTATQQGILIDTGSSAESLIRLVVDGSLGGGLRIAGGLGSLSESLFQNNRGIGLELVDVGPAAIEANRIFNNTGNNVVGVKINNVSASPTVFGSSDVLPGRGNVVHDNSFGIQASGSVRIDGNTVYNHLGANVYGISVTNNATASRNVVYDNTWGIYTNSGTVAENRIYHQAAIGVVLDGIPRIERNVIYSNPIGVRGSFAFGGSLTGNIIYANSSVGVWLSRASYYGTPATFVGNTLFQESGDALRFDTTSTNVRLRNNNIWVSGGIGLNIAADSQGGFQSDYNNLYATGSGAIALWQNVIRTNLSAWRTTAFTDLNSLSVDPTFVNMVGADEILGYSTPSNDGRDDDFHLMSPQGSFHGISFAPVATSAGTGAPVYLISGGNPILDQGRSRLIDRGAPTDSFAAEPTPNGGYINIGAYGGTNQASISPVEYLTVTTPDGGEVWPQEQQFAIRWRTQSPLGTTTFTIELLQADTTVLTIANSAPDTGEYLWTVPASLPEADDYRIRIRRNDAATVLDTSDDPFSIRRPISIYYVNDGTVETGDWTTAVGNNGNTGLSPNDPKASISALLAAYVMKPGDTILVDNGIYTLSTPLILNAAAKGITIRGYFNNSFPTRTTILDRGNTAFNAIELQNADDVTLDQLTIRNAYHGVFASNTSDSDRLSVTNSYFVSNFYTGIYLDPTNDFATLQNNRFDLGSTYYAALLYGSDSIVSTNTFTNNGFYGTIEVRGARSLISNNTFASLRNGVNINNFSQAVPADRITVRDNVFSDMREFAVNTSINVLVTGNDITRSDVGIQGGGDFRNNSVRDGNLGINAGYNASVEGNRIFHNRGIGLALSSNATNTDNRIYDNNIGIQTDLGYSGVVNNNFLVNNTSFGVYVVGTGYYGGTPTISRNTIVQERGDAVRVVDSRAQNVFVRNNIMRIGSGTAINVNSDSGRGFQSDYNVIHVNGTGGIGLWEGVLFSDRADWYYEVGLDQHSLFEDPQFVDLDGPDNVLGFSQGRGLTTSYFANSTLTGVPFATRVETSIGFNVGGGTPLVGLPSDQFSVLWEGLFVCPCAGELYVFRDIR